MQLLGLISYVPSLARISNSIAVHQMLPRFYLERQPRLLSTRKSPVLRLFIFLHEPPVPTQPPQEDCDPRDRHDN
jgi:hypothetical protein